MDKRGHKGPLRRCIASGDRHDKSDMIRFVLSPDGVVTPDILGKLPGRGVYVYADGPSVKRAIKAKGFARGFKGQAKVPEDLTHQVAGLLRRRVLGLITMAMKAGHLSLGFDQVKSLAQTTPLAFRIEAADGSEDGRGKIRVLSKAVSHELGQKIVPVIGCYTANELGQATGRERVVHAALKVGGFSRSLSPDVRRLSGFVPLIPDDWPDRDHEGHSK